MNQKTETVTDEGNAPRCDDEILRSKFRSILSQEMREDGTVTNKGWQQIKIAICDCDHDEFLNFDCGEYKCSACGQEFMVECDGDEGRCQFCTRQNALDTMKG